MDRVVQDLRHAIRRLRKSPGFTLAAVLSLGIGIGANTTLYTWTRAVLLDPLSGVRDAHELGLVHGHAAHLGPISLSYKDYLEYRRSPAVAGMLAHDEVAFTLGADGRADRAWGLVVSDNYFDVLGVGAAKGRTFGAADGDDPGRVAVISDRLWRARFGADAGVVGKAVTLNTVPFTVIGVTPPEFRGSIVGLALDVFVPLASTEALTGATRLDERGNRWLQAIARGRPGRSLREMEAGLAVTAGQLAAAYAEDRDLGVRVFPFWDAPTGGGKELGAVLRALSVVVAIVLLIACANVAGLLIARGAARRREIAVRLSLGATRTRVVSQLLVESLLLAGLAGLAGIACATWGAQLLLAFTPPSDLPISITPRVDAGAFAFAAALAALTALVFGLVPALQASRPEVVPALREGSGSVAGGRARTRARSALVVAQVALSLVLLVSAGLLVRSLRNAVEARVGFDTGRGLLASVDLGASGYTPDTGRTFAREALARLQALPGVRAATLLRRAPLGFGGRSSSTLLVEGHTAPAGEETWAYTHTGGPGLVRTLGATLVGGRDFREGDTREAPRVLLVNETMARRYWPGREALGGRVRLRGEWHTVVGIVRDLQHSRLNDRPAPHVYAAWDQAYAPQFTFLVRTDEAPEAAAASLTGALRALDPTLPVFNVVSLADWVSAATFQQRMAGAMLAAFGILALVLSTLGLYGLLAYAVGQRTREIGIRIALGGARRDIFSLVVRQGLRLAALGVAAGALAAAFATRGLQALLIGVRPLDPATFTSVVVLLAFVAFLASALPARRAGAVDPARALRQD